MSVDKRFNGKDYARIGLGVVLYGFALYTFGLMVKEFKERDFLNAAFYNLVNFTSGTSAKLLIGGSFSDYISKLYNGLRNLSKERKELIIGQLEGFISTDNFK